MLPRGLEPSCKSAAVAGSQGSGSVRSQKLFSHPAPGPTSPSYPRPPAARTSAGERFVPSSRRLLARSAARLWQLQGGRVITGVWRQIPLNTILCPARSETTPSVTINPPSPWPCPHPAGLVSSTAESSFPEAADAAQLLGGALGPAVQGNKD